MTASPSFPPRGSSARSIPVLPQQRLLLQLVAMSGDIAVTNTPKTSILWRTLTECIARGWVDCREISPGVFHVTLRQEGRLIARTEDPGATVPPLPTAGSG